MKAPLTASDEVIRRLSKLAKDHNIALVSDEIYRQFSYDQAFLSPASFNEQTIVIDGFSKSHAMTGWRLGYAHGPADVIDTMIKLQQYTFVCAPQPAQWAGAAALNVHVDDHISQGLLLLQIFWFKILNDFCIYPINISPPVSRTVEDPDFFLVCQRLFGVGLMDAPVAREKKIFAIRRYTRTKL